MLSRLHEFTSANLTPFLESAPSLTLIHFGTDWCAPCRRLERLLLELHTEWGDEVRLGKVNVEDEPELARAFSVTRNPTLCLFRRQELLARQEGYAGKTELLALTGAHLDEHGEEPRQSP